MTAEIQTSSGNWIPYTPESDNGRSNIRIDGVVYSNYAGAQKVKESQPAAPASPTYQRAGVDAEGKNVYQGSDGHLYTDDPNGVNGMGRYGTDEMPELGPADGSGTTVPGGIYTPSQGDDPGTWTVPPAPADAMAGNGAGAGGGGGEVPMAPGPPADQGAGAGAPPEAGGGPPASKPGFAVDPSYLKSYLEAGGHPFQAPEGSTEPGAFSYEDFQSPGQFHQPTAEEMYNDPSYQFRRDQALGSLQNSATGKGLLNSGGTIHDLLGLSSNFASQEYGNVWDRSMKEWQDKYNTALTSYSTNRGNAADIYGTKVKSARDVYDRAWQEYDQNVKDYYNNRDSSFDKLYKASALGAGAATSM